MVRHWFGLFVVHWFQSVFSPLPSKIVKVNKNCRGWKSRALTSKFREKALDPIARQWLPQPPLVLRNLPPRQHFFSVFFRGGGVRPIYFAPECHQSGVINKSGFSSTSSAASREWQLCSYQYGDYRYSFFFRKLGKRDPQERRAAHRKVGRGRSPLPRKI